MSQIKSHITKESSWAQKLMGIHLSHMHVVATLPLQHQLALRNKMDNLLDPDYKRFHLQEAFMATWGRMADPIFKG